MTPTPPLFKPGKTPSDPEICQHLETCDGCEDCRDEMEFFMACDGCGHWGHKDSDGWLRVFENPETETGGCKVYCSEKCKEGHL